MTEANNLNNTIHNPDGYFDHAFTCKHCGRNFSQFRFDVAVILYGLIILHNNDKHYLGITCPSCLNTIVNKFSLLEFKSITERLAGSIKFYFPENGLQLNEKSQTDTLIEHKFLLKYKSTFSYFNKDIEPLDRFNILCWENIEAYLFLPIEDFDENSEFYYKMDINLNNQHFKSNIDNYLCSYLPKWNVPKGNLFSVFWYNEEEIEELIEIENRIKYAIFPRYFEFDPSIDDMENFCWELYLSEIFSHFRMIDDDRDLKTELIDINQDEQIQNKRINEFWSILLEEPNDARKTTSHIFFNKIIPNTPDINQLFTSGDLYFKKRGYDKIYHDITNILTENQKKYVYEKYAYRFAKDYFRIAKRSDFSCGLAWDLKTKYLEIIYFDLTGNLALKSSCTSPMDVQEGINSNNYVAPLQENHKNKINIQKADQPPVEDKTKISDKNLPQIIEQNEHTTTNPDKICIKTEETFKHTKEKRIVPKEVAAAESTFPNVKIISQDSRIDWIKILISKQAKSSIKDRTFLILGETGTGKNHFVEAIHEASGRKEFKRIGCNEKPQTFEVELFGYCKGAFTGATENRKGALENADGGIIFFDEIGDLSLELQKKLLNVFQNRTFQRLGETNNRSFNAIIILATNVDLEQMIRNNEFRLDLYHRFNNPQYTIPALRERKDDIPMLSEHFFDKFDEDRKKDPSLTKLSLTNECLEAFMTYDWIGNIRELENEIKRIVIDRTSDKNRSPITKKELNQSIQSKIKNTQEIAKNCENSGLDEKDELIISLYKEFYGEDKITEKIGKKIGKNKRTIERHLAKINIHNPSLLKNQ